MDCEDLAYWYYARLTQKERARLVATRFVNCRLTCPLCSFGVEVAARLWYQ